MTPGERQETMDTMKDAVSFIKSQLLESVETYLQNEDIVQAYAYVKGVHEGIEKIENALVHVYAHDNGLNIVPPPPDHTEN